MEILKYKTLNSYSSLVCHFAFACFFWVASLSVFLGSIPIILIILSFLLFVSTLISLTEEQSYFWCLYYFFLCTLYFWVGFPGSIVDHYSHERAVSVGKYFIGAIQYVPFFALLGIVVFSGKHFINAIRGYWLVMLFGVYLVVLNYGSYDQSFIVEVRNFLGIFVFFMIGRFLAPRIDFHLFFSGLLFVAIVVSLFGIFEYVFRWDFWIDLFPARYVSSLKEAGTDASGIIGNKVIGINGEVYYRMSSFFYTPPHAAYNFVFFTVMFWYLIKDGFIRLSDRHLRYPLILFFGGCAFLTLIKAGWGQLAIAAIFILISTNKKLHAWLRKPTFFKVFSVMMLMVMIAILLLFLYLQSGVVSTGRAHMEATLEIFSFDLKQLALGGANPEFNILNSDSGVATLIFSTGLMGYIMFVSMVILILKQVLENKWNGRAGIAIVALILGWFSALHFTSSACSPMGNFILFFSAGLLSSASAVYRNVGCWRAQC